jgi:hypothetical protein
MNFIRTYRTYHFKLGFFNDKIAPGVLEDRKTDLVLQSFPFKQNPVILNFFLNYIFYNFNFFHRAVVKQDHYLCHIVELCIHCFVMQPFQNPALCSSTCDMLCRLGSESCGGSKTTGHSLQINSVS